jgi:elongation factor 1 alpha-like protein
MDTVEWSEERYHEIIKKLGHFLRQAGFKEVDISFIPCSGLSGENLVRPPNEPRLASWYKGPTLVHQIDGFKPPERQIDKPFRLCVGDVFKGMGSGFSVSGTVQAGSVQPGDRLLVMPQSEVANVKSVVIDEVPAQYAAAGDNAVITVTGIDIMNVTIGSILCDPANPIQTASRLRARIVVFNIDVPLTKGFPVVFHYQSLSEPAHIRKIISQLHKSTGEVLKKKPRCLTKNMNAMIELEIGRPICVELYKDFKDLGRFMLRYAGSTIAAGLVTEIVNGKNAKND